jgi:hypothetical protein
MQCGFREGWAPTSSGCTDCRGTSQIAKILFIVLSSLGVANLLYFSSLRALFLKDAKPPKETVPVWKETEDHQDAKEGLTAKAFRYLHWERLNHHMLSSRELFYKVAFCQ